MDSKLVVLQFGDSRLELQSSEVSSVSSGSDPLTSVELRYVPPLIGGSKLTQFSAIRPMRYLFINCNALEEWYLLYTKQSVSPIVFES